MVDPENANDGNSIQIPDLCILFRCASRAVTHLYDLVLAPTGMKSTQFIILHAMREGRATLVPPFLVDGRDGECVALCRRNWIEGLGRPAGETTRVEVCGKCAVRFGPT